MRLSPTRNLRLIIIFFSLGQMSSLPSPNPVIILDVDNTIYDEKLLASTSPPGVEEQIVKNIHSYCAEHVSNLPKGQADSLHHTYGTTIEGLRHAAWKDLSLQEVQDKMLHCYQTIWNDNMTYASLLRQHRPQQSSFTTGYSHPASQVAQLRALLGSMAGTPLYLASNSPSWHVHKVMHAMGLANIPWAGVATPDSQRQSTLEAPSYPTKHSPAIFYQDILRQHPSSNAVLIDDSATNVKILPADSMTGIRVERPETDVQTALLKAMGVIDPGDYVFSQTHYLRSKNMVDARSIHPPTWTRVAMQLRDLLAGHPNDALRIVDLGAGVLSMLKLILQGDENLPSWMDLLDTDLFQSMEYFAYEPNKELQAECIQTLKDLGFALSEEKEHEFVFVSTQYSREIRVHLRFYDYNTDVPHAQPDPYLIVGCCFADLMDPCQLVPSLLHRFLSKPGVKAPCLCYFPITFQGITQFIPPQPFEIDSKRSIPSDTVAFGLYSKTLENLHKHSLDPRKLEQAMEAFGASKVASGAADWDIDPKEHSYLW